MKYVNNDQIGAIAYFAADFVPKHWLLCDGKSFSKNRDGLLYSIFRGNYGEDSLSFKVPNLAPLMSNGEALPAIFVAYGDYPLTLLNELCFITPEPSVVDHYMGLVIPFDGSQAPLNWAYCDGSMLKIKANNILFAIIENRFGGDGKSNFALPNIPGHIICTQGAFPDRFF